MRREDSLVGHTLAERYDVLAPLGAGGMGAVYRARDRELDEEVALKVVRDELASDPVALERFRREVKLARRVTHRNVARTFELGHDGDLVFCTMELVDGESLRARLERETKLPPEQAIAIARELCEGLAAAHAADVIHRDIKPENILIARDGRIVLADFGVAAAARADTGTIAGTLSYMAPEQARGEPATAEADVYAVAVVLFEMVTGVHPFMGPHDEVVHAKQTTPCLEPDRVDGELASLIAHGTARDRTARIASASTFGRQLGELAHAAPSAPPLEETGGFTVRTVLVLAPRTYPGRSHLALALVEDLLARLARVPRLRVVPHTSATAEPADAVVELDAGEAVTATITRPASAPVVVRAPLAIAELSAAADAIASAITSAVEHSTPQLAPETAHALELMWSARELMQRELATTRDAWELLERAHEMAPDNALITASCAFINVRMAFFFDEASAERFARARLLVREALATAADCSEAHLAAGHLELHSGRSVRAARHFRDALAYAPYLAETHEQLGRMLLEAGYLDAALERIEHAVAIAPEHAAVRWDVARAWALEGRWEDCERLAADLIANGRDRWVSRLRFAMWRRDLPALARVRAEVEVNSSRGPIGLTSSTIADYILTGDDKSYRSVLHELADTTSASSRRRAFNAQLCAELAGYWGDAASCRAMIELAVQHGMYDRHWLEHCPLLEVARGPELAEARETTAHRANAILDAMYGEPIDQGDPETVAG